MSSMFCVSLCHVSAESAWNFAHSVATVPRFASMYNETGLSTCCYTVFTRPRAYIAYICTVFIRCFVIVYKQNAFQRHLLAYLYCMVAFWQSFLLKRWWWCGSSTSSELAPLSACSWQANVVGLHTARIRCHSVFFISTPGKCLLQY